MDVPTLILICILISFIGGSIFGFYFCMMRYRVNTMLSLLKLQSKVLMNELTTEEVKKELDNLEI
jgi:hypothetical protein